MCFIIATILIVFGVRFYIEGNYANALIYFGLALPLIIFLVFRIIKYKKIKKDS
jgi:hypothetical protein